jgi:hypothetical protein
VELVAPAGVVLEHLRDLGDLAARVADRLAGRQGLEFGQGAGILPDQGGDRPHRPAAGGGAHRPPRPLALAGRRHGDVDDARAGIGERREHAAIGRVDQRELAARAGQHLAGHDAADPAAGQKLGEQGGDAGGGLGMGGRGHQRLSLPAR